MIKAEKVVMYRKPDGSLVDLLEEYRLLEREFDSLKISNLILQNNFEKQSSLTMMVLCSKCSKEDKKEKKEWQKLKKERVKNRSKSIKHMQDKV